MSRPFLTVRAETWPLARGFRIARGVRTHARVVVAEISDEGAAGRGEAVPYARYGETAAGVAAALQALAPAVAAGLTREELAGLLPAGAARNALDCALWDLEAKRSGRPVWDLAGLPPPPPVRTALTISLAAPAVMARQAARLAGQPFLKVKVAADGVLARLAAVHAAAPAARLIVDANEGWTAALLARLIDVLPRLGVVLLEQPLPAADDRALCGSAPPVPVCADESCHTSGDLEALAERYQAVNIKLDKAGGLTEALRMARMAQALGLPAMVGCMVATSLAMAPATLLAPFGRWVDLDGPFWLARDRRPTLISRTRGDDGWLAPPSPLLWG